MREAVGELVAIIRRLRPHVVVTYDPDGGYGHPDHIQAHRVTTEAVAASAGSDYPGEPWQVPKFYWTVTRNQRDGRRVSRISTTSPEDWMRVTIDVVPFGYPDDKIDAVIDAADHLPAKTAAHARARHPGHRRPQRPFASRCPTTSRCPSWPRSTTYSSPESPATETTAAGRPTYSPD